MFQTKEILEEMFPIGYIWKEEVVKQRFYCADPIIFDKFESYYGRNNVYWISPHHIMVERIVQYTIDGYLYDGEEWFPATYEHNGSWRALSKEELKSV